MPCSSYQDNTGSHIYLIGSLISFDFYTKSWFQRTRGGGVRFVCLTFLPPRAGATDAAVRCHWVCHRRRQNRHCFQLRFSCVERAAQTLSRPRSAALFPVSVTRQRDAFHYRTMLVGVWLTFVYGPACVCTHIDISVNLKIRETTALRCRLAAALPMKWLVSNRAQGQTEESSVTEGRRDSGFLFFFCSPSTLKAHESV